MKVDIRSLAGHLASMAWVALRTFVGTFLVLTLVGSILAGLSYYFLSEHHWLYGAIGAAVALIEAVATGIFLGAKRALVMAVAHGLGTLRLGGLMVRLVFERMLQIAATQEVGERGGRVVQALERLPLAQADQLLHGAIQGLMGDAEQVGWFRRKIQTWLMEGVRKLTLARFREEGARHGGVDLLKVKEEMEQTVDDVLVRKVRSGLRLWMLLAIVGLPFVVAMQTWIAMILLHAKG